MEVQEQQESRRRRRKKPPGKRESSGFVQQFGAGMMVSHDTHGIGHVTSSYRRYVNVYFYCDGQHRNLNHRSLTFTREEHIRRSKIRKAMDRGKAVTPACAPGTPVAHRLLGFGMLYGSILDDGKVLVMFDNEYADSDGEMVLASELRQTPPPVKKEDDKKKRRRR